MPLHPHLLLLLGVAVVGVPALALAAAAPPRWRSVLVTGANKGQGHALCRRLLSEAPDTRVFLCSRDLGRGRDAAERLRDACDSAENFGERVRVVQLDVTSDSSVSAAASAVKEELAGGHLYGLASNAGVLWGYSLTDLCDVCATGVARVLDAFLPLMQPDRGRVAVVSSGLGPLMHGYASAERQQALRGEGCTWEDTLVPMMEECLRAYESTTPGERPKAFEALGFPGGPFAEAAPDFHMYGLAKMFADADMLSRSRSRPDLRINSVDPGLVYTDLILKMDRYAGKEIGETGAQTPHEGVEAALRLLLDDEFEEGDGSGRFYQMSKDKTRLVSSSIDALPEK